MPRSNLIPIQCLSKEDCTGCGACMNRCPVNCISMQSGNEGFFYPAISEDECIKCGSCKTACPVLTPPPYDEDLPSCYAAWSVDPDIRFNSTSGGVFTHLAQLILQCGGYIVGARYRADHLVEHVMISSENELKELRQSKYVQSEIGSIFRKVESQLAKGKTVLFAGTPCQCAGLRMYIGRDHSNLYLCDFICRGVNSPAVYQKYLRELEKQYKSPVKRVWFKNKTHGWNRFCTKIVFENNQEYLADRETDPFMLGYIKSKLSLYMRPSCYHCRFKGISRPVDITLGDFWGASTQNAAFDSDKGTSLVMVYTSKGEKLLRRAKGLEIYPAEINNALEHNICATQSVQMPEDRQYFFQQLQTDEFFKLIADRI